MRRMLIAILALIVAVGSGSACSKGGDQNPGASGVPGY
jgi:hypothetical protein